LKIAYEYLIKNYEEITCQQAILKNTVEALNNISTMSMALITQKKYATNEKVRQCLPGRMTSVDNRGPL